MSTTALHRWDQQWCRWYELAIRRGKTPNQAIPIAYRLTEDQRGPRPDRAQREGARSA